MRDFSPDAFTFQRLSDEQPWSLANASHGILLVYQIKYDEPTNVANLVT